MTLLVLIGLAALIAFALFRAARGPNLPAVSFRELDSVIVPVDLEAFRLLCDREQEDFLRSKLSGRILKQNLRERTALRRKYLGQIAQNCVVLMRLAEANQAVGDNAEEARALLQTALQCRLKALNALAWSYLGGLVRMPANVDLAYEKVRDEASAACAAISPPDTSRVTAAL